MTSVNISPSETAWYLNLFTKYSKILTFVAMILRFGYNSRYLNNKRMKTKIVRRKDDADFRCIVSLSMFIQDIQTVKVLDVNNIDNINLTKKRRYEQSLRDHLRKIFREEYLSLLIHQESNKRR